MHLFYDYRSGLLIPLLAVRVQILLVYRTFLFSVIALPPTSMPSSVRRFPALIAMNDMYAVFAKAKNSHVKITILETPNNHVGTHH